MQGKYYRKINLPILSSEDQKLILDTYYSNKDNVLCTCVREDKTVYNDIQKTTVNETIPGFTLLMDSSMTVAKLLSKYNISLGLSYVPGIQGVVDNKNLTPHSDNDRTVNIVYYVSGCAETVFYESENYVQGRVYEPSEINEVDRVNLELNTWYILNTAAIHSVENMTEDRIGISLSIIDPVDNFSDYCDLIESKFTFQM